MSEKEGTDERVNGKKKRIEVKHRVICPYRYPNPYPYQVWDWDRERDKANS